MLWGPKIVTTNLSLDPKQGSYLLFCTFNSFYSTTMACGSKTRKYSYTVKGKKKFKRYLWHDGITWPHYWGLVTRHSHILCLTSESKKIKVDKTHICKRTRHMTKVFYKKQWFGVSMGNMQVFKTQKSKPLLISCKRTCWMICICWIISPRLLGGTKPNFCHEHRLVFHLKHEKSTQSSFLKLFKYRDTVWVYVHTIKNNWKSQPIGAITALSMFWIAFWAPTVFSELCVMKNCPLYH